MPSSTKMPTRHYGRAFLIACSLGLLLFLALRSFVPSATQLLAYFQPQLQQQFHIRQLSTGKASWSLWGHPELVIHNLSFHAEKQGLRLQGSTLRIALSLNKLWHGQWGIGFLTLEGGALWFNAPAFHTYQEQQGKQETVYFPLHIKAIQLHAHSRFGDFVRQNIDLSFSLDAKGTRQLYLQDAYQKTHIQWDKEAQFSSLNLQFHSLKALPEWLRKQLQGDARGRLTISRSSPDTFNISASVDSIGKDIQLTDHAWLHSKSMQLSAQYQDADQIKQRSLTIKHWQWQDSLGQKAHGSALWKDGIASLKLQQANLAMASIWPRLTALGTQDWQQWLSQMHAGQARQMHGFINIDWPMTATQPKPEAWQQCRFKLKAEIKGADIALNLAGDRLSQIDALLSIDGKGMQAQIKHGQWHDFAKDLSGSLNIKDWQDPWLDIHAYGHTALQRLLKHLHVATELPLQQAAAKGHVQLLWHVQTDKLKSLRYELQSSKPWQLQYKGIQHQIKQLSIKGDLNNIRLYDVQWSNPYGKGMIHTLSLYKQHQQWQLQSLEAQAELLLLKLKHFFPVQDLAGTTILKLRYHKKQWFVQADFHQASWSNAFGSHKSVQQAWSLQAQIQQYNKSWLLTHLQSQGEGLNIRGKGHVLSDSLYLNIQQLQTAAFDGAVRIHWPFDPKQAIDLRLHAKKLTEQSIPPQLKQESSQLQQAWHLQAEIENMQWKTVQLKHILCDVRQPSLTTASFLADEITLKSLQLTDVKAAFRLPKKDWLELIELSARSHDKQIKMTGRIRAGKDDSFAWQGLFSMQGNFAKTMAHLGYSNHLKGGFMRTLITGHGNIHTDSDDLFQDIEARLRLSVDQGRILQGGSFIKALSLFSLSDIPQILTGQYNIIKEKGLFFNRLQLEAFIHDQHTSIQNLALRSPAFDLSGTGSMQMNNGHVDLIIIAKPLQNLDQILNKIPLIRSIFGGKAHSLFRKIYHITGPLQNAEVIEVAPEDVGLARSGVIDSLFNLPRQWFGHKHQEREPSETLSK